MKTTLIISTYNWPQALTLCLNSVLNQTLLPDEVLIADDGSTEETRHVIERFMQVCPASVRHIWHEDRGFRLAEIRNKAIAAAQGDYIIQIDGDLILDRHFIADHVSVARTGHFVVGSRGIIDREQSRKYLETNYTRVNFLSGGVKNRLNTVRIPFLAKCYGNLIRSNDAKGCNMAFWRNDLLRVNGYDEDFVGWGEEDHEMITRLMNVGIDPIKMKFRGIVFHIWHNERSKDAHSDNMDRLKKSKEERKTSCRNGISKHLEKK